MSARGFAAWAERCSVVSLDEPGAGDRRRRELGDPRRPGGHPGGAHGLAAQRGDPLGDGVGVVLEDRGNLVEQEVELVEVHALQVPDGLGYRDPNTKVPASLGCRRHSGNCSLRALSWEVSAVPIDR